MTGFNQWMWAGVLMTGLTALPAWAEPPAFTDPRGQEIVHTSAFLASHPDLRYRKLAQEAVADGRLEEARTYFRYGARYADKLSQAALAEMWWEGRGGEQDRALAYAWMDLAAERGTDFLLGGRGASATGPPWTRPNSTVRCRKAPRSTASTEIRRPSQGWSVNCAADFARSPAAGPAVPAPGWRWRSASPGMCAAEWTRTSSTGMNSGGQPRTGNGRRASWSMPGEVREPSLSACR